MARIFVGGIGRSMREKELRDAFSQFGEVSSVQLPLDPQLRQPLGYAFVEMPDPLEAGAAVDALDGRSLRGKQATVRMIAQL